MPCDGLHSYYTLNKLLYTVIWRKGKSFLEKRESKSILLLVHARSVTNSLLEIISRAGSSMVIIIDVERGSIRGKSLTWGHIVRTCFIVLDILRLIISWSNYTGGSLRSSVSLHKVAVLLNRLTRTIVTS